jgi:stage II sporulation protein AA (anti-sigma F factor antagonist)
MTSGHLSDGQSADVVASSDGGAVHISVSGEIDLANIEITQNKLLDAITDETITVSVDLSKVSYIDSTGMRVLFTLATQLRVLHIPLIFIAAQGSPARQVIALSGLDSVAPLHPEG